MFAPFILHYVMSFAGHGVLPLLSLNSVINFVVDFTLPVGLLMELPLVVGVLAHLGLVQASWLARQRRVAIFVAFLLGAVLAPPTDMISRTGIAVGTYLLYESSIVVARWAWRPRREDEVSSVQHPDL